MTFDYARAAATAARLIANFGGPATLRKRGTQLGPSYNPYPESPVTDYPVSVVDLNRRIRDASGTMTGQTMRTLYMDSKVAPAKSDRIIIGGVTHQIAEVRPLTPGAVAVLFEVDLMQ